MLSRSILAEPYIPGGNDEDCIRLRSACKAELIASGKGVTSEMKL